MTRTTLFRALGAFALVSVSSVAVAQVWVPGSEIAGQSATVVTNGVSNTVYFDAGGGARLVTPAGTTVNGTWAATGGQLCLNTSTARECWPYANAFRPGTPVTLTSNCNSVSTWTANGVNTPPSSGNEGERG